ncbi:MAG: hypothetical protein ACFE0P_00775 [Oceanicaulis sp.]
MSIAPRGVFAGFIIAPAFAAAACVFGMMVHFVMTDPAGAALPLGELMPMAGAIWLSALMFAYPAALAFLLIWLAFTAMRLGGLGVLLGGAVCGFAAVAVYLDRIHEGGFLEGLAGGQDLGALTLGQLASAMALPLIGAASGVLGGLAFAAFARR